MKNISAQMQCMENIQVYHLPLSAYDVYLQFDSSLLLKTPHHGSALHKIKHH